MTSGAGTTGATPKYTKQAKILTSEILKVFNVHSVVWIENKTIKTWLAHFICANFDEPKYPDEILQLILVADKKSGNESTTLPAQVFNFVQSFTKREEYWSFRNKYSA